NSAVNEADCGENAKFCHPPPEVTVAHPTPCKGPGVFMLLPVTTRIPIPKLAIVTPTNRKQINEKCFLVVFFIMDSIVIDLYLDRRTTRPTARSCEQWRRRSPLASRSVRTDAGGAARTPQDRCAGGRFPRLLRPTSAYFGLLRPTSAYFGWTETSSNPTGPPLTSRTWMRRKRAVTGAKETLFTSRLVTIRFAVPRRSVKITPS